MITRSRNDKVQNKFILAGKIEKQVRQVSKSFRLLKPLCDSLNPTSKQGIITECLLLSLIEYKTFLRSGWTIV